MKPFAVTRAWVRQRLQDAAARWGILALSAASRFYEVEGRGAGEDEEPGQDRCKIYQHYGYRSRPKARSEVITVPCQATGSARVIIATETPGTGPEDQAEGEVELYSSFGQRVRLRASGRLSLETSHGSLIEAREDGTVVLTDAAGGTATLSGDLLTVNDRVKAVHFEGGGQTPSAVVLPAQGATATMTGHDAGFTMILSTPGNPVSGLVVTITFARPYLAVPHVAIAPLSAMTWWKDISLQVTDSDIKLSSTTPPSGGGTISFVVMG